MRKPHAKLRHFLIEVPVFWEGEATEANVFLPFLPERNPKYYILKWCEYLGTVDSVVRKERYLYIFEKLQNLKSVATEKDVQNFISRIKAKHCAND